MHDLNPFEITMHARQRPPVFNRERLILFTRTPVPGTTKTRLIPALGPEGAADLQCQMTRHVLGHALDAARQRRGLEVEARYLGDDVYQQYRCFGRGPNYRPQAKGDLGKKLADAFAAAFAESMQIAIAIGADCPQINPSTIDQAMDGLRDHDLVLGPAHDGGYYLIAMAQHHPALWQGIDWGSDTVLDQTLAIAARLDLRVQLLDEQSDVDLPEDLAIWEEARRSPPRCEPIRLSVVIPTRNEADHLAATLDIFRDLPDVEVIVVDGGSTDETREIASAYPIRLIQSTPGRGHQQRIGAESARGNALLFLHADTLLPEGFLQKMMPVLLDPEACAGAFRFAINASGWPYQLIERLTRVRSEHFQMPYGDQALFMRKRDYEAVGGMPDLDRMEDFVIIERLRRRGRITVLDTPALTSPRTWQRGGLLKTTLIHQWLIFRHYLGLG